MSLKDVAGGLREPVGAQRTLACAAVNAGITPPTDIQAGDGLQSEKSAPDGATVIVGRFPALQTKRPDAIVLEMLGPNDLPAEAARHVIPGAGELLITASAWCNGTLPYLLRLAQNIPVTLIGPGTPLTCGTPCLRHKKTRRIQKSRPRRCKVGHCKRRRSEIFQEIWRSGFAVCRVTPHRGIIRRDSDYSVLQPIRSVASTTTSVFPICIVTQQSSHLCSVCAST